MELFKKYLVLNMVDGGAGGGGGGAAGGNSIDIEQTQVNSTVTAILQQKAKLEQAYTAANDAVTSALAAFDDGDSNKATLKKVLTNGTEDITSAISTIQEFADKMTESTGEWTKAEKEIADALAAAFGAGGN